MGFAWDKRRLGRGVSYPPNWVLVRTHKVVFQMGFVWDNRRLGKGVVRYNRRKERGVSYPRTGSSRGPQTGGYERVICGFQTRSYRGTGIAPSG